MSRNSGTGVNFVRRTYPPRIFGMALAFPAGAVILYQHQAPWHFWLFAIFGGLLWSHLAYFIASRSKNPTLAEYRNLVMDSVFAGLSVPLLSFNLLPSLVMLTMASLGNITVGGWRLFLKGLIFAIISIVIGWQWAEFIWDDYPFHLEPDMLILIATAPLMVVFPLSLGVINFSLSRRLAH